MGDTRNLGDPAVSAINEVVGEATIQRTPAQRRGADISGRDEQPSTGRYCQAKETKCGRRGGRKSEQLVVAMRAGNLSEGPVGAKGLLEHGTVGGTDAREIRPCKRLYETTADSGVGEAHAGESHDFTVPPHGFGLDVRGLSAYP